MIFLTSGLEVDLNNLWCENKQTLSCLVFGPDEREEFFFLFFNVA